MMLKSLFWSRDIDLVDGGDLMAEMWLKSLRKALSYEILMIKESKESIDIDFFNDAEPLV